MLIVSKCSQCNRGYTAPVTTCQICGGACVPATGDDANVILSRPAPEPVASTPGAECPCCGGVPGPHTVSQQTRHQTGSTLVPMRRKYLVTTVRVPGVCATCDRGLQVKRWLASILLPLPLLVLLGFAVVINKPVAALPLLIYIFYVLPRIDYSWTDFALYGRELSWKLTNFVPEQDREALARYPVGILHIVLRIGLLPALAFGLFAVASIFQKSPPARVAATAAVVVPEAAKVAPAAKASNPRKVALEIGRVFFSTTQAIAVPVSQDTITQPSLGRPATAMATIDGKTISVVKAYASEPTVPVNTSYQLMTGPTVLAKFSTVPSDGLLVVDWNVFFSPEEVAELTVKMEAAPTAPKAVRIRH